MAGDQWNDEETAAAPEGDRPAAPWAWPLLLASVLIIAAGVHFVSPSGAPDESEHGAGTRAGELALLKLQSQPVIASARVDSDSARLALEQMREGAAGDGAVVAVALLQDFVGLPEGVSARTLNELSEEAGPLRSLARKALEGGLVREERDRLRERIRWFAELAPAAGGKEAPKADAIRRRALMAVGLMAALLVSAALGAVAGVALLIWHLRAGRAGGGVNWFRPEGGPRGIMLECVALYLACMAAGELGARLVHPGLSMAGIGLSVALPLVWPGLRGVPWRRFRRSLGWHRGRGWAREIAAGAVGYLAVLAVASIGVLLTLLLSLAVGLLSSPTGAEGGGAPAGPQSHPIIGWIFAGGTTARVLALLLAAVLAPFIEETFFRGALQRHLRGGLRFFPSALLTGVIFASLHPQGWLAIPALGSIGIGLSMLREWRDSLIAPMTAHAINNGALLAGLCLML